jgi:hypothetical protein
VIPDGKLAGFVEQLDTALEIYYGLPDPVEVADDIRELEKGLRSGSGDPAALVSAISQGATELLELHGELPAPPPLDNPDAEKAYVEEIRSRLEIGSSKVPGRRGVERKLIGETKSGHPKNQAAAVLASYAAFAYANATGLPTTRSWSLKDESAFEGIMEDLLVAIQIDDKVSALNTVKRHVGKRNEFPKK